MSWLEGLKQRKIVQWALAYIAGAWLFVEVTDHLADVWGLPAVLIQGLHVAVAVGFAVTLVLAWYHGEQGRQRISGPELLMLAGIFLVGGVAVAALGRDSASEAAETRLPETSVDRGLSDAKSSVSPRSVAVLPLENHSTDEQYAFFADAMSAEISTALARVPSLHTKSYASARRFADLGMTPREFAAELGVAHLLEGSVQRESDRIRITVRLVDARTGEQLWQQVYDRQGVIEAIDIQVDIARSVAEQLATQFSEQEFDRIEAGTTDDPVAYDLYLQATEYDRTSPEELNLQLEILRRVLRRDSTYAIAWAYLGGSFDWKLRTTGAPRWRDSTLWAFRRAAAHAVGTPLENNLRATVALVEGRPEEAVSLISSWMEGFLAMYDRDFRRARDAFSAARDRPQVLPYLAYVQKQLGDSVAARRTLEVARERTSESIFTDAGLPKLATAAVADDPERVARALAEYTETGGRDARWIRRDPVFDRVRDHPAFEAELVKLEDLVERQRRQVERSLAEEGAGR